MPYGELLLHSGHAQIGARAKQSTFCFVDFLPSLQYARGQNAEKALRTGTLATQAKVEYIIMSNVLTLVAGTQVECKHLTLHKGT